MSSNPATTSSLPALYQTYAEAVPELSVPCQAEAPPSPQLTWLNEELARELGYDPEWLRGPDGLALLTGQVPATTAQVYAGHQFGQPNPQLGDGRAVLLGDVVDPRGRRFDLHLKGAGRTPFARAGDGKAPLGPMLREAVIGESLHALGIPTTRALAVVSTGERIRPRQGITPEPGAMLTRVASSHLRVGTFEYAAWHLGPDVLRPLADHAIDRHHPAARDAENPYLDLLRCVAEAQARLVAQWMLVGFVHGVMNTDNMALSGEGIDYGPCAVLDVHRRGAVFSSIDRGGRYAYGNQPGIALWNLSRFAETLLPLIAPEQPEAGIEAATAVLQDYEPAYLDAWTRGMAAKLGISGPYEGAGSATRHEGERGAAVRTLGEDLLTLLEAQRVDHTLFFRALTDGTAHELFTDPATFENWDQRRRDLGGSIPAPDVNPVYIPRNVHVDTALRGAHLGDLSGVEEMLEAVRTPFDARAHLAHLAGPGEGGDTFLTYCGT